MRPKVYLIPADNPKKFRWKKPDGKVSQRVCCATNLAAARRQAREIEEELAKTWGMPSEMAWSEFEEIYIDQKLSQKRPRTKEKWDVVVRKWLRFLKTKRLDPDVLPMRAITYDMLLKFEAWMAGTVKSRTTVVTDVKAFRAGLNFAARNEWMPVLPRGSNVSADERILPPAISDDEFETLLLAVDKVMIRRLRPNWKAILKGFRYGGLRRSEPMDFRWRGQGYHVPDLSDPMNPFVKWDNRQKNGKFQTVAITDEFADTLRGLPRVNEFVFQVGGPVKRYTGVRQLSTILLAIAKEADVYRDIGSKRVYATAQLLRCSFGQHASHEVGHGSLKHLMRHSSIATTMKYYVGDDARMVALDLRRNRKETIPDDRKEVL